MRPPIGTIIGMFPKNAIVLLVYADNILEFDGTAIMCDKRTRLFVV
jgi:hypothetical protein